MVGYGYGAAVSWAVGNIYRGVPEDESIGEEGVEESQPTQVPLDTMVGQLAVRAAKRATASLHGSSYTTELGDQAQGPHQRR